MSDPGCERVRELASGFVDERLEGGELLGFEAHLEACPACREFESGLRRFRQRLRAAAAVEPLRRPPHGFAAAVMARLAQEAAPAVVAFPAPRRAGRPLRALAGLAAAAAAALYFAFSWQRLLPPEERLAGEPAPAQQVALEGGNMDAWLREHALLARGGTILGSAEEVEFVTYRVAAGRPGDP